MSWKIRNNALMTPFSFFQNLSEIKLDRTLAVISERAPMGK